MARPKDHTKIEIIYQSTLKLVMEDGYTNFKMADLAEKAGMATGTLYLYFKNKEELITRLFLHLKSEKIKKMLAVYNPIDCFFITFKKIWTVYFSLSYNEPHKMMFIEQYTYSSLIDESTKLQANQLLEPVIALLMDAQQQHIIKPINPEILLNFITGAALEVIRFCLHSQTKPDENMINQIFDMTWSSIRK